MFLFRKNIILVPSDYDGVSLTKGLVSLDCFNGMTKCALKCYNLNLQKKLLLGVNVDGKLFKFEIDSSKAKSFEFIIKDNIKNTSEISVVLLDVEPDDYNIVLWGSTQINNAWQSTLKFMLEEENILPKKNYNNNLQDEKNLVQSNSLDNTEYQKDLQGLANIENNKIYDRFANKENTDENYDEIDNNQFLKDNINQNTYDTEYQQKKDIDYDSEDEKLNSFIDSVIQMTEDDEFGDLEINDNYKNQNPNDYNENDEKVHFNQNKQFNTLNDNVVSNSSFGETKKYSVNTYKNDIENKFDSIIADDKNNVIHDDSRQEENSFFERLNPQIEKMFETNQSLDVLNEIFPNSKFCKVNFDDGSGYYVFGIIYDQSKPKYLCYGMPAQKGDLPPKEFSELYQWLPIDVNSEDGDGFYMMYQDAETGKNISVEII